MSITTTAAPETGSALGLAVKAGPPVAVSGAHLLGMPVADWIQYLTLAYLVLMLVHKVLQCWREAKAFRLQRQGDRT